MRLILASASPRRAEILRHASIAFEVRATVIDETPRPGESPGSYVCRLALEKARAAADTIKDSGDAMIVGADTVVVAKGEVLGKPATAEDARRMLRLLSGSVHEVHTGLAIIRRPGGMERIAEEITKVTFARLNDKEIERYIATDEPFGKAGAYAVQGIGGRYISRIEGCYFNVVGLPLAKLWVMSRELGWNG